MSTTELVEVQRRNDWLAIGAGILLPFLVAVALIPLRDSIDNTNVALVLMAAVVGIATTGRRTAAIVGAISAAVWFDYFQTQPYYSFTIDRREDWVSVLILLVAGLGVSQLAIWGRRQRSHAERTVNELAALRSVSEAVAEGEDVETIETTASFWLRDLLHARECRYEADHGQPAEAIIGSEGAVSVGTLRWATTSQGLPGPAVYLPVRYHQGLLGYFVIEPTPGTLVTEDRLFAAAAIADQVGIAHGDRSAAT